MEVIGAHVILLLHQGALLCWSIDPPVLFFLIRCHSWTLWALMLNFGNRPGPYFSCSAELTGHTHPPFVQQGPNEFVFSDSDVISMSFDAFPVFS